jgi:hypothetical protein
MNRMHIFRNDARRFTDPDTLQVKVVKELSERATPNLHFAMNAAFRAILMSPV